MFKRVLVTGGAGFIGSHTVDLLLEKGYEVRVFDNLDPQVHGEIDSPPDYLNPEAEFVRGTILDRDALKRALRGVEAVIHDAAAVGVGQSQYAVRHYTAVNIGGTANLFDVLVNEETSVERVLMSSSMSIYGEGLYRRPSDGHLVSPPPRPDEQLEAHDFEMRDPETGEVLEPVATPETKPLAPASVYAMTKMTQEDYALLIGRAHRLSTVACRYFNTFGSRQSLSNPYTGAAAIFISRIKNGKRPLIYEDGEQLRDFTHVRDVARARVFLLENEKAEHESFNVCVGEPRSILTLAQKLAELMGQKEMEPHVARQFRSGDIRHCYGDNTKLKALGWEPAMSFEEGLRELVAWSEKHKAIDRVETAHRELIEHGLVLT